MDNHFIYVKSKLFLFSLYASVLSQALLLLLHQGYTFAILNLCNLGIRLSQFRYGGENGRRFSFLNSLPSLPSLPFVKPDILVITHQSFFYTCRKEASLIVPIKLSKSRNFICPGHYQVYFLQDQFHNNFHRVQRTNIRKTKLQVARPVDENVKNITNVSRVSISLSKIFTLNKNESQTRFLSVTAEFLIFDIIWIPLQVVAISPD